jgi:Glyoxalase/Bleomycin resistance protein/Dioxygenase superfamily
VDGFVDRGVVMMVSVDDRLCRIDRLPPPQRKPIFFGGEQEPSFAFRCISGPAAASSKNSNARRRSRRTAAIWFQGVLHPGQDRAGVRRLDSLAWRCSQLTTDTRRRCCPAKTANKERSMDRFSFGPPYNGVIQIAYTVTDIQAAMRHYTELLHIGPWFLIGPFVPLKGVYRGTPTRMHVSLGLAFAGQMMIELIEQHDEEPSVFRETLKARGAHGFHHWAIGAHDFENTVAHYKSRGYAEAFSDTAPMGFRVVYFDTSRDSPGMLEVIEMNAAAEEGCRTMYQAAQEWDGKTYIVHRIETKQPA